ncbi:peptidoglycan-binding protein [Jatrophihabitans sp.]|uniref:peptidoglycan-binding protein n=1 Tax=Jatrophihabitans sp. TaxID=1932789 RepID=UPI002C01621D|nr:hypothetical protein [Jatrophihabitans sp.]
MDAELTPMSDDELAAEGVTALPDKEVMSLLDLNANLDLALDVAAPIDLAVGANANVAAPINASVGANVLSLGSSAGAEALQAAEIHQGITGDATATADQTSGIDQTDAPAATTPTDGAVTTPDPTSVTGALDGNLLNVNVDLNGDLDLTAPIDGAVAANVNAAAPIDAAVSANVGSIDSDATAIAQQSAVIDQNVTGDATATGIQDSTINQ